MSNNFLSSHGKEFLDAFLDLDYDYVEEIHEGVVCILDSLTGIEGIGKLQETMDTFTNGDLSGLFQIQGQEQLEKSKEQYLNVIAHLMSVEALLAEYLIYLNNGSDGNLTRNSLYLNFNPKDVQDLYDKLEEVISDNSTTLKGTNVDADVQSEYQSRYDELQAKIDYENSLYDDEGNFIGHPEPYIIKQSKLVANNGKYKNEGGSMNSLLVSSTERLQQFEMDIKLMTGDIEGFKDVWNVFKFTPDDAQSYINAQRYDNNIEKIASDIKEKASLYSEEELQELVIGIVQFMNGNSDPMIDFLNEELLKREYGEENEFIGDSSDLVSGLLMGMSVKALDLPAEDREAFYGGFKNLEKLSLILKSLESASETEIVYQPGYYPEDINKELAEAGFLTWDLGSYDYKNHIARGDIDGIEFENGDLKISFKGDLLLNQSHEIKVNDADTFKLIQADFESWKDGIKDRNKELIMLGIALATLGTGTEIEAVGVGTKEALSAIKLLNQIYKGGKGIGEVKAANGKTINDLLGASTDANGDIIPNFIPIMIVEAFENDGGDFGHYQVKHKDENGKEITEVKEVDWNSESSVEEWVDSPYLGYYNPDDREGVVPDVDGIYTNGEALAGIRDEMGTQLDSDGGAGYDGIAGWGYNPRGES